VNRHQQSVIESLQAENRALREQLGTKRFRWTDEQRRRLADKAKSVGRAALTAIGTIVTPRTLPRWYASLFLANKPDLCLLSRLLGDSTYKVPCQLRSANELLAAWKPCAGYLFGPCVIGAPLAARASRGLRHSASSTEVMKNRYHRPPGASWPK
jgi:hypothetical protein